ncbi:MAG TPA: DNA polymerase I [Phycisphaerae bacterium]|nr:DNA polymerase I [Phycisphaerae bacterium]
MAHPSLYIIDGHAQIYRSYYAPFRDLTSPSGEPTRATYVFCSSLFNLIRERRPDYLVMALDTSDETVFRRDIDPDYKANREPPPEDLPPQADRIVSIVEAMGVPILRKPGFEADDLMATLVERLGDRGLDIYLVSKDKDLEQLLCDKLPGGGAVRLYDPGKDQVTDSAALLETKGYAPELAVEIQTLTGDSTDNVPGVKGIGVKTAAKLIDKYGSADGVLKNADKLTPKQKENVLAFAEQMPITRQLVTLRRDVEFPFDPEAARFPGIPVDRVRPIFEELGFGRLTERLESFREEGMAASVAPRAAEAAVAPTAGADYRLVNTKAALTALARDLSKQPAFAFDTETTALRPVGAELVGLSFSWKGGTGWYVPVRSTTGDTLPVDLVVKTLGPVLTDAAIRKVGQNLKYDLVVLKQVGIEVAGVYFDTMIASFVLDPMRRSHGMNALSRELLDYDPIPISDLIGKGKDQITIDEADLARVCEYAAEDADVTWRLYEVLSKQMAGSPFEKLFYETEMPLVEVLAEMEHNGIALNTDILAGMSNTMAQRMSELTREIHAHAGHEFNIDSTKQLANVLFDEQGLPVIRKTKTGRSTDADTLEALKRTTDSPIPPLVLEYRELAKLKGTYVDTLPEMICERTGRVHASFNQTGAVTGRLSSSDPNLQNVPVRTEAGRQIRSAFVVGLKDHTLLVADYSQIELRVLAHFCQDDKLMEAFRTGLDIHAFVAAQVNGVAIEEVTRDQRSRAKAVNFGIIYGQTAFGLARSLDISRSDAESFIAEYFLRYPRIRLFIDECIDRVRKKGYAETILGRRRPIEELRSRNKQRVAFGERIAVNTVIQGSAADLIKKAMIDIHRAIKEGRLQSKMLLQVHDELVFETPKQRVEAETPIIRELMTTAIPLDVPIAVDIATGPNWLESKE